MTLKEAEVLALSTLKQVMEEKVCMPLVVSEQKHRASLTGARPTGLHSLNTRLKFSAQARVNEVFNSPQKGEELLRPAGNGLSVVYSCQRTTFRWHARTD